MMQFKKVLIFCCLLGSQMQAMWQGDGQRDSNHLSDVLSAVAVIGVITVGLAGIYGLSQLDWSGDVANRKRIAQLSREELLAMMQKYVTLKKALDHMRDSSQDVKAETAFVAAGHSVNEWRDAQVIVRYTEAFDAIGESVSSGDDAWRLLHHYLRDLKAAESNPHFNDANLASIGMSSGMVNELRVLFDKDLSVLNAISQKKMEKEWAEMAAAAAKERELEAIRQATVLAREQQRELNRVPAHRSVADYCNAAESEAVLRARIMALSPQHVRRLVLKYDALWVRALPRRQDSLNVAYASAFAQPGGGAIDEQAAYCLLYCAVRELEALKFNPYCTDGYLGSIQYSRDQLDRLTRYLRQDLEYWYHQWSGN